MNTELILLGVIAFFGYLLFERILAHLVAPLFGAKVRPMPLVGWLKRVMDRDEGGESGSVKDRSK